MKITFCKKQYVYIALAVISICLALTSSVFAQSSNAQGGGKNTVPQAVTTQAPSSGNPILEERTQHRLINLVRNATHRMESALLRLENIVDRLEARMDKLIDADVDSPTARDYLKDAKGKLAEARQQLNEARALAENAVSSEEPREQFRQARELFTNIRISIKDAYILIRDAVALLKDAVKEAETGTGASGAVRNDSSLEPLPESEIIN